MAVRRSLIFAGLVSNVVPVDVWVVLAQMVGTFEKAIVSVTRTVNNHAT